MSPRSRRALWTAVATAAAAAAVPAPARADHATIGLRLLLQAEDAGGAAGAAGGAHEITIVDWVRARAITLPELLQLAIRQAPALARAELDVEIAEARIEQARAIDDWTVGASLVARTSDSSFQLAGQRFESTQTAITAAADLTRLLPTGGSVALHGETSWNRSRRGDDVAADFTDTVTATITHPLLAGRGERFFRADQVQARIARDLAEVRREADAIAAIGQVITAYWDLVYAQRDLAIRRSSLELARERLRITQAAIRGGGVAATEALAVEQVIATREEEVLAAELTLLDRSIALRRLVGIEIGPGQLALTTPVELGIPAVTWELDALVAEAYGASPELAALALQGEGAELAVEVAEHGVLPSLDASLTFGPTGIDERAGGALANMVTFDGFTAIARLTYRQSIGNHAATGRAREARAARRRVTIDAADARAQIAQALAQAVIVATSAERRVAIAGRAIDLAEQNIRAEQARFGLGKATNFDVLTRQEELKQAQLRQARAIVDWHKAATSIAAVTGTLLRDYGVTLAR